MIFFMAPLFLTLMAGAFNNVGRKLNDKKITIENKQVVSLGKILRKV